MSQDKPRDNAGSDCNQYVVVTRLDPLMPARRGAEMVAAPVIDYVLSVAVAGWQAISAVILVPGARAATVTALFFVRASEAAVVVPVCISHMTLRLPLMIAAAVVSIAAVLGEGELSCGHRQRNDGGYGGIAVFHLNSKLANRLVLRLQARPVRRR
jgi:hypothetical protein